MSAGTPQGPQGPSEHQRAGREPAAQTSAWPAPAAPGPLDATVSLPGSKSLTARALVLAAAAREPTVLTGVLRSRDTDLMMAALRTLGAGVEEVGEPEGGEKTREAGEPEGAGKSGAPGRGEEAAPATGAHAAGTDHLGAVTRLRVTPSSLPLHVRHARACQQGEACPPDAPPPVLAGPTTSVSSPAAPAGSPAAPAGPAGGAAPAVPAAAQQPAVPPAHVDCGLAGTVMRFVPALAALADAPVVLDGDPAARLRPMAPLLEALTALGTQVTYLGREGFLPVRLDPGAGTVLPSGNAPGTPGQDRGEPHRLEVDASGSSQILSALLLVGPLLPGGLEVTTTGGVPSMAHVRMTVEALRQRGVAVEEPAALGPGTGTEPGRHAPHDPGAGRDATRDRPSGGRSQQAPGPTWRVRPGLPAGGEVAIEPDLSNAGPFLAAALVAGGTVRVPGWPSSTTQAGDAWRTLLPRMGGTVHLAPSTAGGQTRPVLSVHGSGQVHGIDADLSAVGELAPTVAALATVAAHQGQGSRLTGIAHLRGHETDRLAALVAEIRRLGGDAQETDDGLVIRPARLHPARLRSYADHRMATFAAVVGLAVEGVEVDDVECTSKTLPGFAGLWETMLHGGRGAGRVSPQGTWG